MAIVLVLPFALPAALAVRQGFRRASAAGGRSRHAGPIAAALSVVLATGGFWYARNFWLTGNPIYPVKHARVARPLRPSRDARLGLPPAHRRPGRARVDADGGGGRIHAGRRARLSAGAPADGAAIATLGVALFWIGVPYQESRFLCATFGLGAVALGRAAARPPGWLGWGALALALGGELLEFPTPDRLALIPAAVLGAGLAAGGRRLAPGIRPPPRPPAPSCWPPR